MPHEQEQTTGTPEPEITEAEQASGNQATDGRDAETIALQDELRNLREQQKLALAWKQKAERANELEQENAQLRQQGASPSPTMTAPAQSQAAMEQLAAAIQEAEYAAAQGDRTSLLLVASLKQTYQLQQQMAANQQFQQVPTADHADVQRKLASGRFADVQAAYDSVIADRYRAGASAPTPPTPEPERAATGRPMPVTTRRSGPPEYSEQEFDSEANKILATEGGAAYRNFVGLRKAGKVIVK
jgi:hypothetical protein